jgi:nucleoside-diphosphate-sugar epimerase
VAEAALSGHHEISIWGDGEQTRSFTHIDDCVEGTLMITSGEHSEPVNLGSSEMVTINELVSIVEDIAGLKLERHYELAAPKGVRGRSSDNTLIKARYGWEPTTMLRDGMARTYAWVYEQVAASISPAC